MSAKSSSTAFTGRSRRKQTPWTVRLADSSAKWLITVGGIGTIVAVSLVFLFLFAVAIPLFCPARVSNDHRVPILAENGPVLAAGVDEFRTLSWQVTGSGEVRVSRLDTGETVFTRPLLEIGVPTAITQSMSSSNVAIGTEEGTVRVGTVGCFVIAGRIAAGGGASGYRRADDPRAGVD
jgi:phosphate transport system permease protein